MADGSVPLGSLSLDQLQQLHTASQQEVEFFSQSIAQLQSAVERYQNSKRCCSDYGKLTESTPTMVPLTTSIYVRGKVVHDEKLLVDLGTGYFVEQNPDDAEKYFDRRVNAVKEQIEKANIGLTQKRQQMEAISAVLQRKTAMAAAASSGAGATVRKP